MTAVDERRGVDIPVARARALVVLVITALTAVAIVAGITTSMAPLIVVFVLVCPGLSLVGALRLRDPLFEIVLGVALSVSIAGLLATVELFVDAWAPMPTLGLLVAISAAGLLLEVVRIPRRGWASAVTRTSAAVGLQRRLEGPGPSLGEPGGRDMALSPASSHTTPATPASSPAPGSVASATAAIAPSARPRTVPAMGPMILVAAASGPPEPAEAPGSPQAPAAPQSPGSPPAPAPSDGRPSADQAGPSADQAGPSADQAGPSTPTPVPAAAAASAGPRRRGRSRDGGEPPPPPTIIIARRLPDELRPKPPTAGRRGRPKAAVADEAPGAAEPTKSLRSAVRDVVGDVVDRRDGKR